MVMVPPIPVSCSSGPPPPIFPSATATDPAVRMVSGKSVTIARAPLDAAFSARMVTG